MCAREGDSEEHRLVWNWRSSHKKGGRRLTNRSTEDAKKHKTQVNNVDKDKKVQTSFLHVDDETGIQSFRATNALVDISASSDESSTNRFTAFHVFWSVSLSREHQCGLSYRTREANVPLLCGRVAGEVGWVFIDD